MNPKSSVLNRKNAILVTIVALALGSGYWAYKAYAAKSAQPQYRTSKIEKGPITAAVSATGTLNAVVQVSVGSQISGQLKEILVDFNSEVKAGQLIAQIDPEQYQYRLRQSQADVDASSASVLTAQSNVSAQRAQSAQVEVNLAEAKRDYERKKALVDKGFISPAELEKALAIQNVQTEQLKTSKAQIEVALAQAKNSEAIVKQREAQLSQARIDLERTQIRSPVNGVVIKRSVERGQTVAASLSAPELFVIAQDLRDMEVAASIDEADVSNIRIAQKVNFTVDAFPGRTFEGSVKTVRKSPQVVQSVVTYTVMISAANPTAQLLPGMTANVRITTAQSESALKVPNSALRFRPAGEAPAAASGSQTQPNGANQPGAGGQAGGGQQRAQRDRLVTELKLDAAQTEKVDALFADMRSKMGGARELPEEERRKTMERNRSELRVKITEILNGEQKKKYEAIAAEAQTNRGQGGGRGRIYIMDDAGNAKGVDVRIGLTDGSSTEVIAEGLAEGQAVITGNAAGQANTPQRSQASGPRMSF